jgi:hypothetical protein
MRPYDLLSDRLDHELVGPYAREILALAERHGRPQASDGWPEEIPASFELLLDKSDLSDRPDDFMLAFMLEGAVRVLHTAVDQHWFPHKSLFVITRPFETVPEWVDPELEIVIDPNWLPFQREALEVVQRFMDEMVRRGLVRYVVRKPSSLTA